MIFARQGGERRKAGALQGRQRCIAEIKPQRMSIFYLSLVLIQFSLLYFLLFCGIIMEIK